MFRIHLVLLAALVALVAVGCDESDGGTPTSDVEDAMSSDAVDDTTDALSDAPGDTETEVSPDADETDEGPGDTAGDTGTDAADADAVDPDVVEPSCEATTTSNLPGVRIEFTGDRCSWSFDEVQAGIEIPYRIVVEQEVSGVVPLPQDGGGCGQPGDSGLIVFEKLSGDGQQYCLCDVGLCQAPSDDPVTLQAGTYAGTFEWYGRNWMGPSDTGNPRGEPFPAGTYTFEVSAVGEAPAPGAPAPFEVEMALPIELTSAAVQPDPALIGAGWFFGECAGPCQGDLWLSGDQAELTLRNWSNDTLLLNTGTLTEAGRDEAAAIALQLFDVELQEEYGCPDCADGGGFFVELRRKGVESTHTYEYPNPPAALARADAFTREVIDALRTCTANLYAEPGEGCAPEE